MYISCKMCMRQPGNANVFVKWSTTVSKIILVIDIGHSTIDSCKKNSGLALENKFSLLLFWSTIISIRHLRNVVCILLHLRLRILFPELKTFPVLAFGFSIKRLGISSKVGGICWFLSSCTGQICSGHWSTSSCGDNLRSTHCSIGCSKQTWYISRV